MANNLSDWAENKLMDWILNVGGAPTRPTAIFLSLHTADPGDTGASELTSGANGYGRQTATFSAATSGTASNSGAATFGPCATASWGAISGLGIWDATSGGNLLWGGVLATARTIALTDSLTFGAGAITLTLA
jgi:hypothetical protein